MKKRLITLFLMCALSGCVNVAMTCPDKTSTVTYKGLSLSGATSVTCTGSPTGGDVVSVSGMDIAGLAAVVAPLVAAKASPAAK